MRFHDVVPDGFARVLVSAEIDTVQYCVSHNAGLSQLHGIDETRKTSRMRQCG